MSSKNFDLYLTNLIIDFNSKSYLKYFSELEISNEFINKAEEDQIIKLTKLASIIEYFGNKRGIKKLPEWIFDKRLVLEESYSASIPKDTCYWIRTLVTAPEEFSSRNVFYDIESIEPL